MIKRISILLLAMVPVALWAQFAPAQDQPGTTAMHADSSAFVAWATGCTVERGPMRIDKPENGLASYGADSLALGVPGGTYDVVSLGDGGTAILTFESPIYNGEGPDFAVFENGFANAVNPDTWALELGFVEVSSDGVNFFRFPAVTYVQTETQLGNAGSIVPAQLHNFASKYGAFYGTPFDLDEVEDNELLDKNRITHIRIVDVVGNIDPEYATKDSEGHIVNDPWPTAFASSGFDLDAVGVIHDIAHNDVPENAEESIAVYPNPVRDRLMVKAENLQSVEIYNLVGQQVLVSTSDVVDMGVLNQGIYFARINADGKTVTKRVVKQ
ncbi:MAG: T9SS type A sorting domain-containing protein [Bacteroidales bacterium]|nr:T9SS type A sorting domain-containing protein [Bacteroidales bacterium]